MRNTEFKNYMDIVKASNVAELEQLACAGYLLLEMTDRQIKTLANYLATEKNYPVLDGSLTIAQPQPHKVVVFGVCELTL